MLNDDTRKAARAAAELPADQRRLDGQGFGIGDLVRGCCVAKGIHYTGLIAEIIEPMPSSGQRGNRYRLIDTGKAHHRTGDPVEPIVGKIDFRPAPLPARPDTGAPTGDENGYCRFCRTAIFRTWWLYASDQGDGISGPYGNGWRTTWTDRDSVCAAGAEENHTLAYHEPAAD